MERSAFRVSGLSCSPGAGHDGESIQPDGGPPQEPQFELTVEGIEEWSQFKKGVNSAAIYPQLWLFSNFLDIENRVPGPNVWVLSVALPLVLFRGTNRCQSGHQGAPAK
jgi:hypothetical protein